MDLPRYDAAIAANVVSALALLVSGLALYRTIRRERADEKAKLPDVRAYLTPESDRPGWWRVRLVIRNNYAATLTLVQIELASGLMGLPEKETLEPQGYSVRVDKRSWQIEYNSMKEYPREAARNPISVSETIAPMTDAKKVTFFVDSSEPLDAVSFDLTFELHRTDVKRRRKLVVRQQVERD